MPSGSSSAPIQPRGANRAVRAMPATAVGNASGMSISELKRLKELEEENRRLKQMYADLSLEHDVLKDIIEKKLSK